MRKIVTLDIGGTNIKVGIFKDEVLVQEAEIPTLAKQGAKTVIDRCITFIKQYMPCDGIGISTCGQVNNNDGSIHYANENLPGYTGMQVKKIFENEFHVKVTVVNDVYAAARGENQYGAGKGYKDFICLTYGTGIGGGVYLSGQPYYGVGKSAGVMLGGIILQSSTINQPWDGSYESLASTTALIQNAQKFNPCITNGRSLFCHLDDPTIKAVLDAWIEQIAIGLCSLAHVYNVPLFILGGGILEQEYVFNNIKRVFQKYIIPGFDGVQIHQAKLGNRAGIYGALALNLEQSAYYKK